VAGDAPPELRLGVLVLAGERDDAIEARDCDASTSSGNDGGQ
jgi:hypothetical protein